MKVGCAIVSVDFRQVLAVGYNGNATGLPNKCDSIEPGACGCLHAEENAVINCGAPRLQEKIVFCTHLPCKMCGKRLINLGGVKRVIYGRDYRIKDSLQLFTWLGIEAELYNPERYKDRP
jgi:dCMP deaminase